MNVTALSEGMLLVSDQGLMCTFELDEQGTHDGQPATSVCFDPNSKVLSGHPRCNDHEGWLDRFRRAASHRVVSSYMLECARDDKLEEEVFRYGTWLWL
jgi:hypothetical protein